MDHLSKLVSCFHDYGCGSDARAGAFRAILKKRDPSLKVQLLEYDMRFERYGNEFTLYDYNEPEDLPLQLKHCFHIIVADPPYLSFKAISFRVLSLHVDAYKA